MKLSNYVVKFLEENNIKHIFMLSGGGCMHLVDAVGRSKIIKYICNHHEQASAMAAEAYAKFKGELSVVLVTSGPGATNTITGVVGAFQDSAPCLFISGQSKRQQTVYNSKIPKLRQFGVQEVNILPIVESITKYAAVINEPEKIRYHLEKAVYLAKSGRPGPVWLDIPLDVQGAVIEDESLNMFNPEELDTEYYKVNPQENEIKIVIESLKKSKRPIIIAGHGIRISNSCDELINFAKEHNIPIVTPIMGIDVVETEHKNYIGRIGTKGTRAGNFAMQNSDLILSIGSRLSVSVVGHEYSLFAREAKIIVVDIDVDEHKKKTIKIDKFINADAKIFLQKLLQATKNRKLGNFIAWLNKCNYWKRKYPVCLLEYKKVKKGINFYYFVDVLTKRLKPQIPIISDAGSAFYVVSQAINIQKGQRYITSGALATMGFSLPAAIGVSVATGNKEVVAITGDGSFQLNIQELQTIIQNNLPIKIFVINNNGYLSIRQTQKRFFNENYVCESKRSGISFPQISQIAGAYGIKYINIMNNEMMLKKIDVILNYDSSIICEIRSLDDQLVIPTNTAVVHHDGTITSKPLEDMYPFLDRKEFKKNMIVKPYEDIFFSGSIEKLKNEMLAKPIKE